MKLAEIHANQLPDAELSHGYMESAQRLKRELAGYTDSSDTECENEDQINSECVDRKSVSHSIADSDISSGNRTLVGSTTTDTSHTITDQRAAENEAAFTDCSNKEDVDTCNETSTQLVHHTDVETSYLSKF